MDKLLTVGAANTPGSCASRFLALAKAIGAPVADNIETLGEDTLRGVLSHIGMADAAAPIEVILKDGATELEGLVVHTGVWAKLRALAAEATGLTAPAAVDPIQAGSTSSAQAASDASHSAQEISPGGTSSAESSGSAPGAGPSSGLAPGESGMSAGGTPGATENPVVE